METRFWMLPDSAFKNKHKCSECGGRFESPSKLRTHMADRHDIGVTWHVCPVEGCEFKAKQVSNVKMHMAGMHDVGVTWHFCTVEGCDYKTKYKSKVKKHMANVHDIGVTWHFCTVEGCGHKTKEAGSLKHHMADRHDAGVTWHFCTVEGCDYKAKHADSLKHHMADVHDVGVTWNFCTVEGCGHKTKRPWHLKQHMANVHDIGVTWHFCTVEGCGHKTKEAGSLKQHIADRHDVGVTWHVCDVDGCHYRCKQKSSLTEHTRRMHNPVYVARRKKQEERVRLALLAAGYEEWFASEAMPPMGHFKREKRIDFTCASLDTDGKFCRVDFVICVANGFVFLEVDEDQHLYGYDALVSCDMKRMSHVMESIAVELGEHMPYVYWLRYNPSAWRVDGDLRSVCKNDREAALVEWLSNLELVSPLQIGYAFYDCEADGTLDVLTNEHYNAHYADVVENLWDMNVCPVCEP